MHSRLIVFAGVFDPVHKGHIAIAKEAVKVHGGQVVFLPERVPQHKHSTTDYVHRYRMLQRAVIDDSKLLVANYPDDHHTIVDTFTWLATEFPDRKLAWMVGNDVAGSIAQWPGANQLQHLGVDQIIVALRQDADYQVPSGGNILGTPVVSLNSKYKYMNSSFVRQNITHRHTSLPDSVYDYIKEHGLYTSKD